VSWVRQRIVIPLFGASETVGGAVDAELRQPAHPEAKAGIGAEADIGKVIEKMTSQKHLPDILTLAGC